MIHYSASPIVQELEETYEKLLEERNNLARAADIHKRLTEEIIRGNDLQSISNVVHETFGTPLLIEDLQFRTLAQSTFLESKLQTIKSSFHSYLDDKQYLTHIKVHSSFRSSETNHTYIITGSYLWLLFVYLFRQSSELSRNR